MNLGRLRARRLRERVILLLLPLLALRVLVPEGFMPRIGAGHEVSMQMCHGDAQSAAAMRLLHEQPATPTDGDHSSQRHDTPCVFAASAGATPVPLLLALPDAAATPDAVPRPTFVTPVPRVTHRIQSARAPPLPA
jgi:hypothetical protein